MSLALRFPHDGQHVLFGFAANATRLRRALIEQLGARGPGVTSKRLGIAPGFLPHCLDFGHRLRPPSCGVHGGPLPHRVSGLLGRLQHRRHLATKGLELGLQVTVGVLAQPGREPLPFFLELVQIGGDALEKAGNLIRIEAAPDGTELRPPDVVGGDVRSHRL